MRLLEESTYWVERPESNATETVEWRFTLREMSVRNAYNWCRSMVYGWIAEETGISEEDFTNDRKRQRIDVQKLALATEMLLDGTIWSHIYSSLSRVEQRMVDTEALQPLSEWVTVLVPESWATPKGFLESTTLELAQALEASAVRLNPTFHISHDNSKKKFGLRPSTGQSNESKNSVKPSRKIGSSKKSVGLKTQSTPKSRMSGK